MIIENSELHQKDRVTVSEKLFSNLIDTALEGQKASSYLDAVVNYVTNSHEISREVILKILGVETGVSEETVEDFSEAKQSEEDATGVIYFDDTKGE